MHKSLLQVAFTSKLCTCFLDFEVAFRFLENLCNPGKVVIT